MWVVRTRATGFAEPIKCARRKLRERLSVRWSQLHRVAQYPHIYPTWGKLESFDDRDIIFGCSSTCWPCIKRSRAVKKERSSDGRHWYDPPHPIYAPGCNFLGAESWTGRRWRVGVEEKDYRCLPSLDAQRLHCVLPYVGWFGCLGLLQGLSKLFAICARHEQCCCRRGGRREEEYWWTKRRKIKINHTEKSKRAFHHLRDSNEHLHNLHLSRQAVSHARRASTYNAGIIEVGENWKLKSKRAPDWKCFLKMTTNEYQQWKIFNVVNKSS